MSLCFEHIDYRADTASPVDGDDQFANAFAAALLMPEKHVRGLRAAGLGADDLARTFGVTEGAMVNRLKHLGLYRS